MKIIKWLKVEIVNYWWWIRSWIYLRTSKFLHNLQSPTCEINTQWTFLLLDYLACCQNKVKWVSRFMVLKLWHWYMQEGELVPPLRLWVRFKHLLNWLVATHCSSVEQYHCCGMWFSWFIANLLHVKPGAEENYSNNYIIYCLHSRK